MHRKIIVSVAVLAAAAPLAISAASPAAAGSRAAPVTANKSAYGTVLFDAKGRSLYTFARDHGRKSSCYGSCAKAWPPLLTTGKPRARAGARQGLIGTTRRRDGSLQVTYAGHPLYGFAADTKRGQITCQNVSQFGGKWLVIRPSGKVVR